MTAAQIELMQSDLPHTLFLRDKKGEGTAEVNPNDKAFRLQEEANRRARERREGVEVPYTMKEIFN